MGSRKLGKTTGITLTVVLGLLLTTAADCKKVNPDGTPRKPAPAHDPKPLNHTTSPSPQRKIHIRLRAIVDLPERPHTVMWAAGRGKSGQESTSSRTFVRKYEVPPYTKVSIIIFSGAIGGEVMGGYTQCDITVYTPGGEPVKVKDFQHSNGTAPVGCQTLITDED